MTISPISKQVQQVIIEDRLTTTIIAELGLLVAAGLLSMGISVDGDAVYWPTPQGAVVLGMELADASESSPA